MTMREGWYKGKRHCVVETSLSSMKTVRVRWDDETKDIVPIRMVWRKEKEVKSEKTNIV